MEIKSKTEVSKAATVVREDTPQCCTHSDLDMFPWDFAVRKSILCTYQDGKLRSRTTAQIHF